MPEQFSKPEAPDPVNPAERKDKSIPTPEEVQEVMRQMVSGEFQETKRLFDEKGRLTHLEALAQGREEGETMGLYYMRTGRYPDGDSAGETKVHSVYLKDSEYNGEGPQATWVDGRWIVV